MPEANADVTEDAIYGGRVRIRQPARGYRVNVDTILLAASVGLKQEGGGGRFIELGCGVGAALLCVAQRFSGFRPFAEFVGIERDEAMAALARENAQLNNLASHVRILTGDALSPPDDIGVFDNVFFNPPYDPPGVGRAPAPERQDALIADAPTSDWIKVWSNRMSSGARMTIIQRAQYLKDILDALDGRLGAAYVLPIRLNPGREASRIIVTATKGSRGPLRLLSGLDLHPSDKAEGKYTPQVEAILRGEEVIWQG